MFSTLNFLYFELMNQGSRSEPIQVVRCSVLSHNFADFCFLEFRRLALF
jgi:hypothetical protein